MTLPPIARRAFAALVAGSALVLAACGGGGGSDSGGSANWRAVNLTSDVASMDLYAGSDKRFAAVASGALTSYGGIDVAGYSVKVTAAGDATSILASTFTFAPSKDKSYTAVATGRSGAARLVTLLDDEDTSGVADGVARVRIYNAATDSGTLDVYISNAADLSTIGATFGGVSSTSSTITTFRDVNTGTYRLRITGAGDPNDVRLDVTGLTLDTRQASTLVITSATGGPLVNAAQLVQGGAITLLNNTSARLRLLAGVEAAGTVQAKIDGTAFGSTLTSPSTPPPYSRVTAGSHAVEVLVNGASVSTATRTFAAGGDYTMVVSGAAAAPVLQFITDDNRLPAAGRFRMRLVHADATYGALSVWIGGQTLSGLGAVEPGTTSAWAIGTSSSAADLEVLTVSGSEQLVDLQDTSLLSQGVYSIFVLGGKTAAGTGDPLPTIRLSKDR